MELRRNTIDLESRDFDLLVIGAGIHGVCVARDAAMRGLSVALIDRGDLGGETSHNSLKIIHGGIRYLQHLDFARVRQSIVERRFWLRCAPHLVRPLKFIIPGYGYALRGVAALAAATGLYNLLSIGSNRGVSPFNRAPRGGVMSRARILETLPELEQHGLTGAAYWYDGQMLDADRVLLECVESAVEEGAVVCNYVRACSLLRRGHHVCGVAAQDAVNGREFEIRATQCVNTAGPWASHLVSDDFADGSAMRLPALSKCMNLVTRPLIEPNQSGCAFGIVSQRTSDSLLDKSGRMFFVTPWKGLSIVGTSHLPYSGHPDDLNFSHSDIDDFLDEINAAYPFNLSRSDVLYCYGGLTPAEEGLSHGQVTRIRRGQIVDHQTTQGIEGLVTVIGVKYTTARLVAEKTTDLVFRKLNRLSPGCQTHKRTLPGVNDGQASAQVSAAASFGSRVAYDPECLHYRIQSAIRNEMAIKLADFVLRRSDLAETGQLSRSILEQCADTMAVELGWDENRRRKELDELQGRFVTVAECPVHQPKASSIIRH